MRYKHWKLILFLSAFALLFGVGLLACSFVVASVGLTPSFLKSTASRMMLIGCFAVPCLTAGFAYHKMTRITKAANRR